MYKGNIILLVLCLLGITTGIALYLESSAFQKDAIITKGIVTHKLGSSYRINYTSDDQSEHTVSGSQKNNKYHEGDIINVYYRIENPDKARISDGKKTGKNIIIIASIFLLLDMISYFQSKRRIKSGDNLQPSEGLYKNEKS